MENSHINLSKMLKEIQRVLKPGGSYIAISFGEPEDRTFIFN